MSLALVAAQAENRVIGKGSEIPWRVKGEQALFREITMNGTLLMGRKTYDSIGRPLPGRTTIVISRNQSLEIPGCEIQHSLEDAVARAGQIGKPVFVAGGGELYQQALPHAETIHLTTIHTEVDGDVFFPEIPEKYQLSSEKTFKSNINYTYRVYVKEDTHAIQE